MSDVERLGRRIADVEEALTNLARYGVGLGHSSFDDGAIRQYTGRVVGGSFGTQFDGSNGVAFLNGPTPPTPRWTDKYGPMAEGVIGGLRVRWEGFFEPNDFAIATMDHKEVEVHVSDRSDLDGIVFDTLKTTITSARGGEVLIPMPLSDTGYYIRLRTRTVPGKASAPSTVIGPFKPLAIRQEDLGFDLNDLQGSQIFWGDTEPETDTLGDLWLKTPEEEAYRYTPTGWELAPDQASVVEAILTTIAADTSAPGQMPLSAGDALASRPLVGNGSIKPHSLVARDVIATGTVSAALLEAILILATTIIAGDPTKTHVKIKNDGVYVYAEDASDGIPNEVIRMGTQTNDFFGITDENGMLITSLDDTGAVNGRTANFREDIVVAGRSLKEQLSSGFEHNYGFAPAAIAGVQANQEVGLIECAFDVYPERQYWLFPEVSWHKNDQQIELKLQIRATVDGSSPTINSTVIYGRQFSGSSQNGYSIVASTPGLFDSAVLGISGKTRIRFLVTARAQGAGSLDIENNPSATLNLIDLGPKKPIQASINRGGGSAGSPPPPPKQQYDTGEMAPLGWLSISGSGAQRTDVSGPVQGWDPSGTNGNGKGYWYWNIPSITGIVDRVDVYLYAEHWYYSSGGTAVLNAVPGNAGGSNFAKARSDWHVGGFPRPGGRWLTLPADWFPLFHDNGAYGYGKVNGISVGPGNGTDLNYYGKFTGSAARLRIWYSQ